MDAQNLRTLMLCHKSTGTSESLQHEMSDCASKALQGVPLAFLLGSHTLINGGSFVQNHGVFTTTSVDNQVNNITNNQGTILLLITHM